MTSGQPLDPAYSQENLPLVEAGFVCTDSLCISAVPQNIIQLRDSRERNCWQLARVNPPSPSLPVRMH